MKKVIFGDFGPNPGPLQSGHSGRSPIWVFLGWFWDLFLGPFSGSESWYPNPLNYAPLYREYFHWVSIAPKQGLGK